MQKLMYSRPVNSERELQLRQSRFNSVIIQSKKEKFQFIVHYQTVFPLSNLAILVNAITFRPLKSILFCLHQFRSQIGTWSGEGGGVGSAHARSAQTVNAYVLIFCCF